MARDHRRGKSEALRTATDVKTLASEVYGTIRRRILEGDLPPGLPISRRRVAEEARMSLIPVAEALHRLEFEGLLESRPRAGTRIRIPSKEAVEGHYVVWEALEVQAAMRAAVLASNLELTNLGVLAERVDALALGSHPRRYAKVHQGFHRRIATYSRCKALRDALDQAHAFATLWWCQIRQPTPDDSGSRHRALAEAISSRDSHRAAEAMRRHIAVAAERSMETLEPIFQLDAAAAGRSFRRGPREPSASRTPPGRTKRTRRHPSSLSQTPSD